MSMSSWNLISRLSERNRLLVLSVAVGLVVGLAAVVLKSLISLIQHGLSSVFGDIWNGALYFIVLPGVGMLLAMLFCRYILKDNIGHGVTKALQAVSRHDSRIKPHNMWSSVLASSVTIGFGGSVGAEAPIVYTGAAIGSNFARKAGMSYRSMTILLGCGAAAAVAGIFKAPLAGILFVLEILLFNISMNSMMPLLLSTVSATVVSYIFLGRATPFECTLTPFDLKNIPFYIILGIFCGGCSIYFTRTTLWLEDRIGKMSNPYLKWILCAIGLGLLIFLFPPLHGEGYESLGVLLNGHELSLEGQTPLAFLSLVCPDILHAHPPAEGLFNDPYQRRWWSGRDLRTDLVCGSYSRFRRSEDDESSFVGYSSFSTGAEFRPCRHGRPDGRSHAGPYDSYLPYRRNIRRLRSFPSTYPYGDNSFRDDEDSGKILYLHKAYRPERGTADT